MRIPWHTLRTSLVVKLAAICGLILFLGIVAQAWFTIRYQEAQCTQNVAASAELLGNTVRLATHYAMMMNSQEDINNIIRQMSRQEEIVRLRIISKSGEIKFSKRPAEVGAQVPAEAQECRVCHRVDPPLGEVRLGERTRLLPADNGHRLLGLTSPIYNEPTCSTEACHAHPPATKVLGILDVVISMEKADREIAYFKLATSLFTLLVFLLTVGVLALAIARLVKLPIQSLVRDTRRIAAGDYAGHAPVNSSAEMGTLAAAINDMGREIERKQAELNRQRDKYQELFEVVPCLITVQDRDYRLTGYNRKFAELFAPRSGDFCYSAYKGRDRKCDNCPVERTFRDGHSHFSEEAGINKDGTPSYWIVTTSPLRNEEGEVVAAMEMSLDVTQLKILEKRLLETEKRYRIIFNNIPNPVFLLEPGEFTILDGNRAVADLYGLSRQETVGRSFLDFFDPAERREWAGRLRESHVLYQARQRDARDQTLYVNINISPMEDGGREVLLVTTSDITSRVEAEQQLVQAGKMATLGEMATGVAHELNQPLSVIKTASSYFMRKVTRREAIPEEILLGMSQEIDTHVDRATRIINHMREFGRKASQNAELVVLNDILLKAFEIFSQQLKLRGIDTRWRLGEGLPRVKGDPGRLEQVFINLLINARDAIEERWEDQPAAQGDKSITLSTFMEASQVVARVQDSGRGIPPHLAEKIFEPFFTTKKVGQGTGLGLSISYGIIKDCGGSIRALTCDGPGGCIEVRLPAAEEET
jgi:histidine kinase